MDIGVPAAVCQMAVRASEDDVRQASEWLDKVGGEQGVPPDQLSRLDLCLNEVLANIIAHGGPSALEAAVVLSLDTQSDQGQAQAVLTVSDTGTPFNPLMAGNSPQAQTLEEAIPGGLGLTMISGYSDQLDYVFRKGRNHLTVIVRWDASA